MKKSIILIIIAAWFAGCASLGLRTPVVSTDVKAPAKKMEKPVVVRRAGWASPESYNKLLQVKDLVQTFQVSSARSVLGTMAVDPVVVANQAVTELVKSSENRNTDQFQASYSMLKQALAMAVQTGIPCVKLPAETAIPVEPYDWSLTRKTVTAEPGHDDLKAALRALRSGNFEEMTTTLLYQQDYELPRYPYHNSGRGLSVAVVGDGAVEGSVCDFVFVNYPAVRRTLFASQFKGPSPERCVATAIASNLLLTAILWGENARIAEALAELERVSHGVNDLYLRMRLVVPVYGLGLWLARGDASHMSPRVREAAESLKGEILTGSRINQLIK